MRIRFRGWKMGAGLLLASTLACGQALVPARIGEITYLAGGVGGDELAAMRAQAQDFNVRIEFVELEEGSQHGNWTADAAVDIRAPGREPAHIEVPGPLLMLRMPAGTYTIEATRNGERQRMDVTVGGAGRQVFKRFVWRVAKGSLGNDLRSE